MSCGVMRHLPVFIATLTIALSASAPLDAQAPAVRVLHDVPYAQGERYTIDKGDEEETSALILEFVTSGAASVTAQR